jgi:hypothetical protein
MKIEQYQCNRKSSNPVFPTDSLTVNESDTFIYCNVVTYTGHKKGLKIYQNVYVIIV